MENKNIVGLLFVALLFAFMVVSIGYHICGELFNSTIRGIYYHSMIFTFIIGLLVVIYRQSNNTVKKLIKYSAIPYFSLQLIYTISLYLEIINSKFDLIFIIIFILIFFLGLYKIKTNHDLTIEN